MIPSAKRRIAVVTAYPPSAGSLNEYGFHLVRHLALRPDVGEVIVLADRLPAGATEPADPSGKVRVLRMWEFNRMSTLPRLRRALLRERPDGVIFNLQTASFGDRELPAALGLFAPMVARLSGIASGVIAHNVLGGVDLEQTVLAGRPIRQAVVRLAAGVVNRALLRASYVTTTLGSYVDVLRPLDRRADLTLVPHGTFDTEARDWRPHDRRPRRIVTMGKFGTYKRLDTLLAAFDLVRREADLGDVELVIGGTDHPNAAGYLAECEAARRTDPGVRFHGYVAEEDVAGFFESARLSVFDYQATTGSSGVLHQTAGYGAYPIFPRIGDFVDICRDEGIEGGHYEPGDAAGMAAAIVRALRAPDQAERAALANLAAARGMPFSDVVAFHIDRIEAHARRGRAGARAGRGGLAAYPEG